MTKSIVQIGINNFNHLLCDGISGSMFDLYCALIERGCDVTIFNFYTSKDYTRYLFKNLLQQVPEQDILFSFENCSKVRFHGITLYQEMLPFEDHELAARSQEILKIIFNRCRQERADIIVTLDDDIICLLAASLLKISGCHFIHSPAYLQTFASKHRQYTKLLQARSVFAASRFVQHKARELLGIDTAVWYPVINLKKYRAAGGVTKGSAVGFYSFDKHKGADIINALIARMPEQQFIVMGRSYAHNFSTVPENLTYLGDVTSIMEFYSRIGLLLVPSVAEEAFTRVSIEAAVNGIPVIANRVGGIPEALGESGILIDVNLNEKIDADAMAEQYRYHIDRLLNNQDLYREYREKALQRAGEFEEEQNKMLKTFCETWLQ